MAYISKYSGEEIDGNINQISALSADIANINNTLNDIIDNFCDRIYPVGSIYMSLDSVNPSTKFGGTWEQIQNRFLVGVGSNYSAGDTGGNGSHQHTSAAHTHTTADHVLTEAQMPKHQHRTNSYQLGYPSSYSGQTTYMTPVVNFTASYEGLGTDKTQNNYVGSSQAHNHGNTGSTTPGATGSSSNIPPYFAVYMWQRTA